MYSLDRLGWCAFFEEQLSAEESDLTPARVAEENRGLYRLYSASGESWAELSGKLRHAARAREELPAVGDWVLSMPRQSRATIHRVLERRTKFSRKIAGKRSEEQIVAANVDVVFLVSSLNREFNPRRIERYLILAWESGARPVVVLNKADLCEEVAALRLEAESAAMGVRVVVTSTVRGDGIAELQGILRSGGTTALLGSSGVGKSSLINALLENDIQATKEVRPGDDRGRHATTSRQLIVVPGGGLVMDTPGMRELQLWDAGEGLHLAFADIQELAQQCKFRDCSHHSEPGCVVRESLDEQRLASYHKLEREERFVASKQDDAVRAERRKELKKLMKAVNRLYRERGQ